MDNATQEAQGFALQQAASQYGVPMQFSYGDHLPKGAQYVLKQAEIRGVVIHSISDLTQQAIHTIAICMAEAATAFANGALSLSAINQQVQGTEYGAAVRQFNNALLQNAGQQIHTLLNGSGRTLHGQLGAFEITEQKRNWIQRLLSVE